MIVCDWSGWDGLQTFLDHYRGTHTPEAQLRERGKVDFLEGGNEGTEVVHLGTMGITETRSTCK